MANKPKVSVVCISYNQEKFIEQALDSFLSQKTDFKFEVLIGDDCSKDNTSEIIEKYSKDNPDIIKPILRERNIGIANNLYDLMRKASGEYIALCEGDDYWIDPRKLQMQVDFLEKNLDYSICFHPVQVIFERDNKNSFTYPDLKKIKELTIEGLLKSNFIQTNSVLYRKQDYTKLPVDILPVDWYLHLYHAQKGKIGFINKTMAVYRRHSEGIWQDSYKDKQKLYLKYGLEQFILYLEILKLFPEDKYQIIIQETISTFLDEIQKLKKEPSKKILRNIYSEYPIQITERLLYLNRTLVQLQTGINETALANKKLRDSNEKLKHELKIIKNSRVWRMRNKFAKIFGKNP